MNYRFNIGDRVLVVQNTHQQDAELIGVNGYMNDMVGEIHTIRKRDSWQGFPGYRLEEDVDNWLFPESMLEIADTVSFLDIIQEGEVNG